MKILTIILLVLFCGCKEKKDSPFWGLKAGDTMRLCNRGEVDTIHLDNHILFIIKGTKSNYKNGERLTIISDSIYINGDLYVLKNMHGLSLHKMLIEDCNHCSINLNHNLIK